MRLYLVQHGEAKSKQEDPERSLTDSGVRAVGKVAGWIRAQGLTVHAIWHSSKQRAVQTAEILSPAFHTESGPVERDGLAPRDDVGPILKDVLANGQDLVLVGHLPFLDRLASRLVAADESAGVVAFRYGCMVCLEQDEAEAWQVRWMLIPELLP